MGIEMLTSFCLLMLELSDHFLKIVFITVIHNSCAGIPEQQLLHENSIKCKKKKKKKKRIKTDLKSKNLNSYICNNESSTR